MKHLGWSNNGTFFWKTTVTEFILFMLFLFGDLLFGKTKHHKAKMERYTLKLKLSQSTTRETET